MNSLPKPDLIFVIIAVVWCREDCHEGGEACARPLPVHLEAGVLHLVAADDGEKLVVLNKLAAGGVTISSRRKN